MSPDQIKLYGRGKGMVKGLKIKSDSFSFGLSMLEMGNLFSVKNIRLNKDKNLLDQ